jgi:hypothetical protein
MLANLKSAEGGGFLTQRDAAYVPSLEEFAGDTPQDAPPTRLRISEEPAGLDYGNHRVLAIAGPNADHLFTLVAQGEDFWVMGDGWSAGRPLCIRRPCRRCG